MMFRAVLIGTFFALVTPASAQRPTATFAGGPLMVLDLGGQRVFVDGPGTGKYAPGEQDIVLHVKGAAEGLRVFSPALTGEALERRSSEVGESTGVYVYPKPTPATDGPHVSYLVQWNGRRMWFCGDTEDPTELLATKELDAVFLTPAVAKAVEAAGRALDARYVLFYHTTNKEQQDNALSVPCDRCKVSLPWPGEVITLFR
jgi:hypothetical protein